jgi:outer membrane protein assembly factor BamB
MSKLFPALIIPVLVGVTIADGEANTKAAQAHDWPQWQGPERDNKSRETGLLRSWPKEGPKLLWRASELGGGYSAPTIAAGRIFGLSYQGDDEVVWAREVDTGRMLWTKVIAAANRQVDYREGSRGSATADGDLLYALGVSGDLLCLRVADGSLLWRKHLIKDFDGVLPFYLASYGYAESPLIDGDKVIVTPGGPKATLVALDKRTGKTMWTAPVPEVRLKGGSRAAYSSVVAGDVGGLRLYVQFLQGGLVGVSATDGKLLWRWDKPSNDIANVTTPIFHDDLVFASSGYGKGCGLARLARAEGALSLKEIYFNKNMKNVHGGVVLVDGHVYGNSDPGMLVCLELKSGKVRWQERSAGKGSIVYADGHLYYRDETGPMLLVEANAKEYVEKGRFDPPGRSRASAWSHPVVANGRLYLRDQDVQLCYDVKAAK